MSATLFREAHCAQDHATCLVLVSTVGQAVTTQEYNHIYQILQSCSHVRVNGAGSQLRHLQLRYKQQSYSLEENAWGEFQSHRKCLGLICVAKCRDEVEFSEASVQYDAIRQRYEQTLYDTRMLVLGLSKPSPTSSTTTDDRPTQDDKRNCNVSKKSSKRLSSTPNPLNANTLLRNSTQHTNSNNSADNRSKSPTNAKTAALIDDAMSNGINKRGSNGSTSASHLWFYKTLEEAKDLEERIKEFAASIFWILESKRLDRAFERQEKLTLLMAPPEVKEFAGVDTDSRVYRKRCFGRFKKHIGDLCLQAGLAAEALLHYQTCAETLRSVHDWLWLAGAFEGMCSASVMTNQSSDNKDAPTHTGEQALSEKGGNFNRNLSFSVKRGVAGNSDKNSFINRNFGKGLANGLDLAASLTKKPSSTVPDDVIDKYKEALTHYSKYNYASLIEIQASIKAANILIAQRRHLEAAEFLQNIVCINQPLNDEVKIDRFVMLADMYTVMGFQRKAGFFRRVAGMQCVAPTNPKPNWQQCYTLLRAAVCAYRLSLDYRDTHIGDGWPVTQLRLLHELIFSAKKLDRTHTVIRHIQLLLHTLFEHLLPSELTELCSVLESYTKLLLPSPPAHTHVNHQSPSEEGDTQDSDNRVTRDDTGSLTQTNDSSVQAQNSSNNRSISNNKTSSSKSSSVASSPLYPGADFDDVPSVPFVKFPAVKSVTPVALSPHLRPTHIKPKSNITITADSSSSPFIYSPMNALLKQKQPADDTKLDFQWVVDGVCEVVLMVANPMPFDLRVTDMRLLTEGVDFTCYPTSITLPAYSGLSPIHIMGTPNTHGQLTITGYTHTVLGLRSDIPLSALSTQNCNTLLPYVSAGTNSTSISNSSTYTGTANMISLPPSHYDITVVSSLPQISLTSSLPKATHFIPTGSNGEVDRNKLATNCSAEDNEAEKVVTNGAVTLHTGQICEFSVTIVNIGKEQIEMLETSVKSKVDKHLLPHIISYNTDTIHTPLHIDDSCTIMGTIHAPPYCLPMDTTELPVGGTHPQPTCLPDSPCYCSPAPGQSSPFPVSTDTSTGGGCNTIDSTLLVTYSGGGGIIDHYYRQAGIVISIELQQAVVCRGWDSHAISHDVCCLSLDLENITNHDIEVTANDVCVTIYPHITTRLQVDITRVSCDEWMLLLQDHVNNDKDNSSDDNKVNYTSCDKSLSCVGRQFSKHVADSVTLQWKLKSDSSTHGMLCISSLLWSPIQVKQICRPTLCCETKLSGKPVDLKVGVLISFTSMLRNISYDAVKDFHSTFSCYQDKDDGNHSDALATFKALVIGCTASHLHTLAAGDSIELDTSVIFMYPGRYTVQLIQPPSLTTRLSTSLPSSSSSSLLYHHVVSEPLIVDIT